ncbi:MAG: amino acid adenylation domain-containing protein [Lachnospiraceae bacterium]|nr:amino acid adenylation domain-containing protein [Lachnospiraceae bacterium]
MEEFIKECSKKGIVIECKEGNKLSYKATKGPIDRSTLLFMKENKEALISYLKEKGSAVEAENEKAESGKEESGKEESGKAESGKEESGNAEELKAENNRYDEFPLTDIQSAYHAGRQSEYDFGGTGCYTYLEIKTKKIEAKRFEEAWHNTIMRHDMLKAKITRDGKQYVQTNPKMPSLEVYEVKENGKRIEDVEEVEEMRKKLSAYDFKIGEYPMHKFIIGQGSSESIVHFSVDMLVADFVSINIILSDVFDYYKNGSFTKEVGELKSFKEIVLERRNRKASEADRSYWMKKIEEGRFTELELPLKQGAEKAAPVFKRRKKIFNKDEYARFKEIVLKNGITINNAILTNYARVLSNWMEDNKICINVTLMQRNEEEKKIVGDFTAVNLLCLEINNESFKELAKRTQMTLLSDISHMSFSGVEVMREINKRADKKMMFPAVFTSTVGTDSTHDEVLDLDIIGGISRTPQVWIDCQVLDRNGELEVHWDVREGVIEEKQLNDIWNTFCESLQKISVTENWDEITDVTFPEGYFDKINEFNAVTEEFEPRMFYDGFINNVTNSPEKVAIIQGGVEYTYGKIGEYVSSLESVLLDGGVKRGDNVAIVLPRGPLQISAAMAILLCGAAFVPIDINQPFNRQEKIIETSEAKLVFALENHTKLNEKYKDRVINPERNIENSAKIYVNEENTYGDLAYIIFTSGTTGAPKGVMITHEQAENTIIDMNKRFNVTDKDVFLALTKLSFDLSIYDLFGSFDAGATLVMPEEANATNPSNWAELISKYGVTIWNSVPALLKMYIKEMQSNEKKIDFLRCFFLSGDVIDSSIPAKLREMCSNYKLISLGGATEGSIWSIYWDITDNDEDILPYGAALTNQKMLILDKNGKQLPIGVKGEIVIGGKGVAAGYYNDEALTSVKFTVSEVFNTRLFHTGDVGYIREDGVMMICGRRDNQVKINGNRIEIGEIESAVRATNEAADCAVVYHKNKEKGGKLVLFLEPKETTEIVEDTEYDYEQLEKKCRSEFEGINRKEYMSWRLKSDEAALADMYAFFRQIGIFLEDREYTKKEIHEACKEQEEFGSIIDRFLRALEKSMLVKKSENGYKLLDNAKTYFERDRIWDEFMELGNEINYGKKLMEYQRESGKHILEQVRGEITGISLFFPEGGTEVARAAYADNMINSRLNAMVLDIMQSIVKKGDKLLEIGAGVGGTTSTVLEGLKTADISYCFTDISQFFINKAKNVYKDYDFINYKQLDINKDYSEQGFKEREYDVILCANVLHNSTNIGENLSKIKKLIKPNGHLIIIEATSESYLLTTSLELKGGLAGFTDFRANGIDVFISGEKWLSLVKEAGYKRVFNLPDNDDVISECGQGVILCKNETQGEAAESNVKVQPKKFGSGGGIDVALIEKYMASNLPKYMIPEQIEIIDKIPLTTNGKVDRKQMAAICDERIASQNDKAKPEANEELDGLESKLAEIWKSVLGVSKVSKNDNFYYVGGDSLLITQVVSEMRKEIPGLESVSWDELMHNALNNPTIEGLAEVIKGDVSPDLAGVRNEAREVTERAGKEGKAEKAAATSFIDFSNKKPSLKDSSVVIYRDVPEKRRKVQAFFHAGTGRLADYEFLIPDILERTDDTNSLIGFVYGNDKEYLSAPKEQLVYLRAEKYASILMSMELESYELIGYCVGGFLALETARIMLERGAKVERVVMISSELATHMVSNQLLMEIAYGAAIGLDMRKTGLTIDINEIREVLEEILEGENRNIKNSELLRLKGKWQKYGDMFIDLCDEDHEGRLKHIFDSAGGDKFNGNESTFAMFKLLYNIFDHTFKGMMNYPFTGNYLGKVLYLEAPTMNSFYPHTRKKQNISDVCVGDLEVKKIAGNHATCLLKENYKDVLNAILS